LELEVIDANGAKIRPAEVEQLASLRRPVAQHKVQLVVAVQVVLVGPATKLHALQQLLRDIGVSCRCSQRW